MAKKKNEFQLPESYDETPQEMVDGGAVMEDYNPLDDDLPYIPSLGTSNSQQQNKQPQFLNLSNPENITNMVANGADQNANPNATFNTQLEAEQALKNPNFKSDTFKDTAFKNKGKMASLLDQMNGIVGDSDKDSADVRKHATGVAIKHLYDAIKMLKEVDYWIPEGKEEFAKPLQKIAEPIIQALTAYVNKVSKLE